MLITDFDGTLMDLDVDWAELRRRLGVERLIELWERGDPDAFTVLAGAEREGARRGADHSAGLAFINRFPRFAVLTDNSESAVSVFFQRHPDLQHRCAKVAGRETLAGPKRDRDTFARGVRACLEASPDTDPGSVTYLGNAAYELIFARELGLVAVDVATL